MKPTNRRLVHYAAVFFAGTLIGAKLLDWSISNDLSNIYRYDVEVRVVDAATDKPLPGLTISAPSISTSDLFQQSTGMSGANAGLVGISGIAYEPREWSFGAKGYESASVIINQDTQPSITIRLKAKE